MKTISRYIMTLALLLTAVTGAWAEDTYTVQFKANGNTKTVEDVTLPHTFECDNDIANGELDLILKELYGWTGGSSATYCVDGQAPQSDDAIKAVAGLNERNQYITISNAFEGNVTVTGMYMVNGSTTNYSLEISISRYDHNAVTATLNTDNTEATMEMPASDVTVTYELVRDMQDEANPVAFSGLPSNDEPIIVKKGSDGKYQPAEALTIQLIDPLAAAEDAKNIIGADGITVKVLVGNGGTPIEYDQDNPITLEAFLADMKPGYYWIKAEPTDENSPYDGTVYSSEFTVVEKYDLTVKPANDFSKGKIDKVVVGTDEITPDATTGEATKTGIAPDTEVKIKAKRGYIIEKVEAKKKEEAPALLSIQIGGATTATIYYVEGETWGQAIQNHPTENSAWSIDQDGSISGNEVYLFANDDFVYNNHTIEPNANYSFQWI